MAAILASSKKAVADLIGSSRHLRERKKMKADVLDQNPFGSTWGTVPDILQERNLSSLVSARPFCWCSRGFTKTWWVKLLTLSNCQARRRIFVLPDISAIFVIIVDIFVIGAFSSYWMCALVTDISNPITARCRFLLLLVHHR